MARTTAVELLDDITGEPAEETLRFALDGAEYDIDLSGDNADALRALLNRYVESGRRTGGRKRKPRVIARPKPRKPAKATKAAPKTAKSAKATTATTPKATAKATATSQPKAAAKPAAAAGKPATKSKPKQPKPKQAKTSATSVPAVTFSAATE